MIVRPVNWILLFVIVGAIALGAYMSVGDTFEHWHLIDTPHGVYECFGPDSAVDLSDFNIAADCVTPDQKYALKTVRAVNELNERNAR